MGVAALHGLDELVHDMLRRGLIGIAHAEVDDILTPGPRGVLEFRHNGENVGRQALDTGEIFDHWRWST